MAYHQSQITHSTTGVKTRTIGFQPQAAELIISIPPNSSSTAAARLSIGSTDGSNHNCDTFRVESSRRFQDRFTDRIASVWEWNGSAWTEVFRIEFDSFTATELKYNVVIGNANYQVLYKVWG